MDVRCGGGGVKPPSVDACHALSNRGCWLVGTFCHWVGRHRLTPVGLVGLVVFMFVNACCYHLLGSRFYC